MATASNGTPDATNRIPWKLRGHIAYSLVRDLAEGTLSQRKLATKYDVAVTTITAFARREAKRIEAVKADLDNVMAGLWAADKQRRIAEYQQDIDLLNDSIEAQQAWIDELAKRIADALEAGETDATAVSRLPRAERELGAILKRKHAAQRSIAEELGQLPNRVNVQITGGETPVLHQIVGIDPNDV